MFRGSADSTSLHRPNVGRVLDTLTCELGRALRSALGDSAAGPTMVVDPRPSDLVTALVAAPPVRRAELAWLWGERFDVVAIGSGAWEPDDDDGTTRQLLHAAVQHLAPNGLLVVERTVAGRASHGLPVPGFGMELVTGWESTPDGVGGRSDTVLTVYRRSTRFNVHDLVHEARCTIDRISAPDLWRSVAGGDPVTVLDTRTDTDRWRVGVIAAAVHVPRTVLEWHVDPDNGYLHPAITSFDQRIVVVCNGGFSSSIAAAHLVRLGFSNAADVVGGMDAWCAAGLPLVAPDHSHLDPTIRLSRRD